MSREDRIRKRLADGAERPWKIVRHDLDVFIESEDAGLQCNLGYVGNRVMGDAELIVNAPDDLEYLLGELDKTRRALGDILYLGVKWDTFSSEENPRYAEQISKAIEGVHL